MPSPHSNISTKTFMGLEFNSGTKTDLLDHITSKADSADGFSYIVTPNADIRVRLEKEPELLLFYEQAWLCVNDSRIIQAMARLMGLQLPALPGSDIVAYLIEDNISKDEPFVIIGGNDETKNILQDKYGFTNIHQHMPPMGLRHKPDAIREAAEFIKDNPSRFIFICVGAPQQEMIAHEASRLAGAKGVALCCGASIDFLTGHQKRAPKWMQVSSLEWLYRLLSKPQAMWKRYLIDGPRIFMIALRYPKNKRYAAY